MSKIAFIFPGQGSQTIGMGKSFYENSDVAKEMFEKAGEAIGIDFKELLFEENEKINETAFTQPAILLVSLIAHKLFTDASGIKPELLLGHSLGEFSAITAAGAINYIDAVKLVHKRGQLMQEACAGTDAGMMAVIGLDDEGVQSVCAAAQAEGKKVWPANYNQNGQLVLAGLKADLSASEAALKEAGAKKAILLNMSIASHCDLLASAQPALKETMDAMLTDTFTAPVISNVSTQAYNTKADALELLTDQLCKPVKYKQSIEAIAGDADIAIEFGNGKVLAGLNKRINKELKMYNISDMETLEKALSELNA
jgi:[acyl-carrier-protein] S-malonyltransferase